MQLRQQPYVSMYLLFLVFLRLLLFIRYGKARRQNNAPSIALIMQSYRSAFRVHLSREASGKVQWSGLFLQSKPRYYSKNNEAFFRLLKDRSVTERTAVAIVSAHFVSVVSMELRFCFHNPMFLISSFLKKSAHKYWGQQPHIAS